MPRSCISHSEPSFFSPFVCVFALVCLFAPVFCPAAQTIYPASTQSNSLDNTNEAARSAAMGSAFTGVADDASALFTNPAGLGFLRQGQIFLNSDFWLVGTFQETALVGFRANGLGGFAFAAHYLDYGQMDGRDELGNITAGYGADQGGLVAGWGGEVLKDFSVGLGVQALQTTLAGVGFTDLTSSFGALWKEGGWGLGASYVNLGWLAPGGTSEAALNLGASYDMGLDSTSRLLTALGSSIEPDAVSYFQAGLEYSLQGVLFLRAGFQVPLAEEGLSGLTDLTAGVGFAFSSFHLDYAYLPYGNLGAVQRASVGYFFGAPSAGSSAAKAAQPQVATPMPSSKPPSSFASTAASLPGLPPLPPPPPPQSPVLLPQPPASSQPNSSASSDATDSFEVQFKQEDNTEPSGAELEKQGKYREALAAYLAILRQNPRDSASWWALGNCYRELGQKTNAIQCFQQVLQLQPNNQALANWLQQYQASNP